MYLQNATELTGWQDFDNTPTGNVFVGSISYADILLEIIRRATFKCTLAFQLCKLAI